MSEYASDEEFDEGTRIRLTWNRIKRNQMVQPTIKKDIYIVMLEHHLELSMQTK